MCRLPDPSKKQAQILEAHVVLHRQSNEKGVSYTCNMCQKELASRKALKTHFSANHSDKAKKGFICKVCNKVLETGNARSLHYKVEVLHQIVLSRRGGSPILTT